MPQRTAFLGLDFDPLGSDEAPITIAARARRMEPFAYAATPNVDHMVRLDQNPELRPLYADAWLNLCDSRVLELFAKFSNVLLPAAPGADVVQRLFEDHIHPDDTVVVIGGTAKIARKLRERYRLNDLRWLDAPPNLKDDAHARSECGYFIRANPAPWIFLAVGSPQQEMIAHEVAAAGDAVGVAICCGASLEFLAGEVSRAPKWMRDTRLEWMHRLGSEPARLWRRYLVDGPRILGIWRRWVAASR
ncbi:MAG: WecB/TagA/CpsF family glycosyltransferase [Hyphomonadaceae bacterium]|nr:WecB/TagA/CpsF family glycosyltransferase [Hyphomonadaceae bacterium]